MPELYAHPHRVEPAEIDVLGHANNLHYLKWMMAAATGHSRAQGWPLERYKQLGSGWVVRAHNIEYLRSAYENEELIVRTWVASFKRASSRRRYRLRRATDGVLLAEAYTDWAYIDFDSGRVTRVPAEVIEAFVALGDSPDGA